MYTFNNNGMIQNIFIYSDMIIDAGGSEADLAAITKTIKENNIKIKGILLTHGHWDHIENVEALKELTGAPIYCHELEEEVLVKPELNLSSYHTTRYSIQPDKLIKDGDKINDIKVLHTPGHTPGGVCYYDEKNGVLFSGDTMFRGAVGRTDFPGSDHMALVKSIREKLFALPDDIKVYPGHESFTTIGEEKGNYR